MPLGLIMLVAAGILILIMWIHNAWPEFRIRRFAAFIHVPVAELQTHDPQKLLDAVKRELAQHYRGLHYATNRLVLRYADDVGVENVPPFGARFIRLSGNELSEYNLQEIIAILWVLDDAAGTPPEHAIEARRFQEEAKHLLSLYRRWRQLQRQYGTRAPA